MIEELNLQGLEYPVILKWICKCPNNKMSKPFWSNNEEVVYCHGNSFFAIMKSNLCIEILCTNEHILTIRSERRGLYLGVP